MFRKLFMMSLLVVKAHGMQKISENYSEKELKEKVSLTTILRESSKRERTYWELFKDLHQERCDQEREALDPQPLGSVPSPLVRSGRMFLSKEELTKERDFCCGKRDSIALTKQKKKKK